MRRSLIAGNWKMNCGPAKTKQLLTNLQNEMGEVPEEIEVLACPPSISLTTAVQTVEGSDIRVGAQNVYFEDNGAYTGEISTQMVAEAGCSYVIVGHSERREYFGETDAIVNAKIKKVLAAGLRPIVCIGETLDQRKAEEHRRVVKEQIHAALNEIEKPSVENIVFAYEPIWAIGTGETATPGQAQEMHAVIREEVEIFYDNETAESIRILYGGSMKPGNAEELLLQNDVDGGLLGGASLKADSFAEIIGIAERINTKSE